MALGAAGDQSGAEVTAKRPVLPTSKFSQEQVEQALNTPTKTEATRIRFRNLTGRPVVGTDADLVRRVTEQEATAYEQMQKEALELTRRNLEKGKKLVRKLRGETEPEAEKLKPSDVAVAWDEEFHSFSPVEDFRWNTNAADGSGYDRRAVVAPILGPEAKFLQVDGMHGKKQYFKIVEGERLDLAEEDLKRASDGGFLKDSNLKDKPKVIFERIGDDGAWLSKVPESERTAPGAVVKAADFVDFSKEVGK